VSELCGGHVGARRGRRAGAPRRSLLAAALIEGATVRDMGRELARLRNEMAEPGGPPALRTSSSTHVAWVPEEWEGAARETLEGLAERHPPRGIMLLPVPESQRDELDAEVLVRCFRNESL